MEGWRAVIETRSRSVKNQIAHYGALSHGARYGAMSAPLGQSPVTIALPLVALNPRNATKYAMVRYLNRYF